MFGRLDNRGIIPSFKTMFVDQMFVDQMSVDQMAWRLSFMTVIFLLYRLLVGS